MSPTIVPVAKSLFHCDYHVGYSDGKVDLYGIFNAIRPQGGYPHTHPQFCVFAQLVNGLGQVPFFVDIRDATSNQLIYTTGTNVLSFPNRTAVVQVALTIQGCTFPGPGLYFVELFCDNTWVCDTTLLMR